jgi:Arc/MetJ family transcription regulator
VPVNSRAGIPAQGRFERIVHAHGQDVGSAVGVQKFGEIITEADEAIRFASEELAVDPDLAVHVHPVELDDDLLAGAVRKRETFPIPADAVREKAAVLLALRRRVNRAFDAPVVRQIEVRQLASSKPGCLAAASSPR